MPSRRFLDPTCWPRSNQNLSTGAQALATGREQLLFISWSGPVSKGIAEALHGWLPVVLPYAKPWFSSHDIDKGSRWSEDIRKALIETDLCIACITPNN